METGDPDVYKAFCWRFWDLVAPEGGRLGIVLPRSALSAKGSAAFRRELFRKAGPVQVTVLLNAKGWVFDEAEHRYTIGLVTACRGQPEGKSVSLRGPFNSLETFASGKGRPPSEFTGDEIVGWTDSASLPLLPGEGSLEVFAQLRKSPRLDRDDGSSWRARPHAELHATNDKGLMDLASARRLPGYWPVFKGESFDLWAPDTGRYYAWADPDLVLPALQEKRLRGARTGKSAFSEFGAEWLHDPTTLPCHQPRVAFRDITNRTNQRTMIAALLPPRVFVTNKGPCFLWPRGSAADQAYLLGVLASVPLDWYARRFVEMNVNFFLLNPFPVPRPGAKDRRRQRVVALAGRLACPDERFAGWAEAVGVACGPLADDAKEDAVHELDAVVAHLYGLTEKQLVHVFETFHEGWDYEERLRATLRHFRAWQART
jgi:hypothetical protein